MSYDLRAIEHACLEHRLPFRRSEDWVEVDIVPHGVLVFANIDGGDDTYLYFRDLPWPSHGNLQLMIGTACSVEYTPEKMIQALVSGEILVVSYYVRGELRSRSFAHREDKLDLQDIEPEEEMRVCRIAEPGAAPNGGPAAPLGDSGVAEGPPHLAWGQVE